MFKPFHDSIAAIHMVEASPTQRNFQRHLLCQPEGSPLPTPPKEAHDIAEDQTSDGIDIKWHFHLDDVPKDNSNIFLVAHEFFDALPVHQFEVLATPRC